MSGFLDPFRMLLRWWSSLPAGSSTTHAVSLIGTLPAAAALLGNPAAGVTLAGNPAATLTLSGSAD